MGVRGRGMEHVGVSYYTQYVTTKDPSEPKRSSFPMYPSVFRLAWSKAVGRGGTRQVKVD